jgi:hypothetical protein
MPSPMRRRPRRLGNPVGQRPTCGCRRSPGSCVHGGSTTDRELVCRSRTLRGGGHRPATPDRRRPLSRLLEHRRIGEQLEHRCRKCRRSRQQLLQLIPPRVVNGEHAPIGQLDLGRLDRMAQHEVIGRFSSSFRRPAQDGVLPGSQAQSLGLRSRVQSVRRMTYNVIPSSGSGQVRSLVEALKDVAGALAEADPKLKAQVYEELGVTVTYDPDRRVAKLESRPQIAWAKVSVGGGT